MAKMIVVANNKGGSTKTTTTCNLAHALARLGKKVLVVDIDSQSNTTTMMTDPASRKPQYTLYDLLDDKAVDAERTIIPSPYKGVDLIPNERATANLEPGLIMAQPRSFFILRDKLREYALANYDFCLIDAPPNIGYFVLLAMHAADCVLVPTEVDSTFSHEGIDGILNLIETVRGNNPHLTFLKVLASKVDNRTRISKNALEFLQNKFKDKYLFTTTIPINTDFKWAEQNKQTIIRAVPQASGAKAYRALAAEVLQAFGEEGP